MAGLDGSLMSIPSSGRDTGEDPPVGYGDGVGVGDAGGGVGDGEGAGDGEGDGAGGGGGGLEVDEAFNVNSLGDPLSRVETDELFASIP